MQEQIKEQWPRLGVASLGRAEVYGMRRGCLGGESVPAKGNSMCKARLHNKRGGTFWCTATDDSIGHSKPPRVDKGTQPLGLRGSVLECTWWPQSQLLL